MSRAAAFMPGSWPPSARAVAEDALTARVQASFVASDRTDSARQVWYNVLAGGVSCDLHPVEQLMREDALRAPPAWAPGGYGREVARDDRGQRARSSVRGQRTQTEIGDGRHLYLDSRRSALGPIVIDLFSRRAVGWSVTPP